MGEVDEEGFQPDISTIRAVDALWNAQTNPNYKPNRNDVEEVLERVARGSADPEDRWFMQELAAALLAAGGRSSKDAPANERARNVLKASGLSGTFDRGRELASFVELSQAFEDLDTGKKTSQAAALRSARQAGVTHLDAESAKRLLRRRGQK